jgi:hypothetical protein
VNISTSSRSHAIRLPPAVISKPIIALIGPSGA